MDDGPVATPLSFEWFAPLAGQAFGLWAGETMLDLVLADVALLPRKADAPRPAFSLLFEGTPGRLCPQGTYRLHHETVGTMDIFLVPLRRHPDDRYRYQAVFA